MASIAQFRPGALAVLALVCALGGCGGGGGASSPIPVGGGGATPTPTPGATASQTPTAAPTATPTASPTPTPTAAPSVTINAILVAVNPSGAAPSVAAYPGAFTAGSTPMYSIAGSNTGFTSATTIRAMAIGSDGNLYVLDAVYNGTSYASEVRVWPATTQGNVAPTAIIPTTNVAINPATSYSSSTGPANAIGLDGSNNLYVGLLANPQVVVFAAGTNGSGATPIRSISTTDNGGGAVSHYLFVNANGSLIFVAGPSGAGNTVGQAFPTGANGAPTPTATFQPYYSSGGATLDMSGISCGAAVDASGTFYIGIQGFPPSVGAPAGASAGILEVPPAMQSGRQQVSNAIVDTALTNMQTPCVMQVVNGSVYATDFNTHKLLQYPANGTGIVAPAASLQLSSYGPAVLLTTPYTPTSAM